MVRWLGLLAFAAFSTCAPAFAADCTVTETIHTPDGLPAKGVRVEFIALAPQTVGTLISSKAVVGTTDASGVLRDAAGAVGVTFTQGAIVRVQAPDLGLKGQKILVPNTTSATLHALVASYMTPGTAPAVDDATDLVMGVNDNGLVTITTGETIAAAIEAINQAALPGTLTIQKAGSTVASRATLNIIDGSNVTTTVADDAGNSRVNITVASSGGGGGGGGLSDGDYGDVVVGGSGTTLTVDTDAISYAKMQNVSATDKLLGRSSSGAGDVEEISCGSACRNLLDDSDAATMRLTLGLDTAALLPSSSFEVPLTFSTGLTRSTNTVTVNSTQLISRLSNLSTNGFVKTGSANGTLSIDTSTYLTGNQSITFTGDATGSGSTSVALTIPADTVTNAKLADMNASTIKGNATGGATNPTDLTGTQATALLDVFTSSLKGLAPSSGGGTSTWLRADGTWTDPATFTRVKAALGAATSGISVNGNQINSLNYPTGPLDAANRDYVDIIAAASLKYPVRVASTANLALSGTQTIDGIAVTATQRVLAKNQTTPSENGPWAVASGAWTRPNDYAGALTNDHLAGFMVYVQEGTANADTLWALTTDGTITIDSTSVAFAEVDHKAVLAGTGLTRSTNTLSVNSSQSIATLSNLTTNGYVRTSGAAGTLNVDTPTQTTAALNAMVGDSGSGGTKGLVPAPSAGDAAAGKFLKADGTYAVPAGSGGVSDGDKGDITVSSSGATFTVDNDVVTYAKMQNVSATDKLLGRSTAGSGDVEEIALTSAGRALIDDADAAAQRTTLGLGTAATLTAGAWDTWHFQAESLDDADANWPTTANAVMVDSVSTASVQTRKFLGASATAAGGKFTLPTGSTTCKFSWAYQASSAPGATNNKVRWRLDFRPLGGTASMTTYTFADQTNANNTTMALFSDTETHATTGMSTATPYQFQIVRVTSGVTNNMTQDAYASDFNMQCY